MTLWEKAERDLKNILARAGNNTLTVDGKTVKCTCAPRKLEVVTSLYGSCEEYTTTALVLFSDIGRLLKTGEKVRLNDVTLKVGACIYAPPSLQVDLLPALRVK